MKEKEINKFIEEVYPLHQFFPITITHFSEDSECVAKADWYKCIISLNDFKLEGKYYSMNDSIHYKKILLHEVGHIHEDGKRLRFLPNTPENRSEGLKYHKNLPLRETKAQLWAVRQAKRLEMRNICRELLLEVVCVWSQTDKKGHKEAYEMLIVNDEFKNCLKEFEIRI